MTEPVTISPTEAVLSPLREPPESSLNEVRRPRLVWPRLLLGLTVLIGAEVFSGASLQVGLWHPWTLVVTFWLYFAHFFLFTTLAVWTGRTSFWSLYLWGVLYGLYESWITKVIWHGYAGDGKFALGALGPFGFSEISMVLIYHPLMSFILPLAVACVAFPSLRRHFPDVVWFTGSSKWARIIRAYLMVNFGAVVAMNSGGPLNLVLNLVFVSLVLAALLRLSRPSFSWPDARPIVVFGRPGFAGLCGYLLLLYGLTYFYLRPAGLPSAGVQVLTAAFYGVAIGGLWLHRRREPAAPGPITVESTERRAILRVVAGVLGLGFVLSFFRATPVVFIPVVAGFVIWTPLGMLLLLIALAKGIAERRQTSQCNAGKEPH
jgi:hypothetical protein